MRQIAALALLGTGRAFVLPAIAPRTTTLQAEWLEAPLDVVRSYQAEMIGQYLGNVVQRTLDLVATTTRTCGEVRGQARTPLDLVSSFHHGLSRELAAVGVSQLRSRGGTPARSGAPRSTPHRPCSRSMRFVTSRRLSSRVCAPPPRICRTAQNKLWGPQRQGWAAAPATGLMKTMGCLVWFAAAAAAHEHKAAKVHHGHGPARAAPRPHGRAFGNNRRPARN